jgi:diguanylate cyclase (GGDEF)-like protein/PAS domain S-box-containing protein
MHPDFMQAMHEALLDSINNKKPFDAEYKIIRPSDGVERWMHGLGQIAYDDQGGAISLIGTVQDITERKRVELALLDSQTELKAAQRLAQIGNWHWDIRADLHTWSEEVFALYGLPPQDGPVPYPKVQEYFTAQSWAVLEAAVQRCRDEGCPYQCDAELVHNDGSHHWVAMIGNAVRDQKGSITALHGTLQNITERKAAEEAQTIAATAFESQQGMFIADAQKVILRVNKAFTAITGFAAGEAVGQTPSLLKSGQHDTAFYAAMWDTISRSGVWQGEIWNRHKNGKVYPEHLSISTVKNAAGLLTHYVGAFSDLTSYKAAEEQINDLAYTDLLTGLPNRRLLIVRLQQAITAAEGHQHQGALLLVDLDNFKNLNDSLGHARGDEVLQRFAKRLSAAVGDGDTVARLGGDEFAVLLDRLSQDPQKALRQAQTVVNRMLEALKQPYELAGSLVSCTASIGITFFGEQYEETLEPFKRAELAMYQAKSAGRATLRFFEPQMQAVVNARVMLEEALRQAINKQQFTLYYQAQVSDSEGIMGVEALLRWFDPKRGMVSPAEFIPLAEETGLILPIGNWVLEAACQQLVLWAGQPERQHLSIAVNVSARQFRESNFVAQVLATLERTGANAQRLKLELTESVLIADAEDVIVKMNTLKAIGVGFAIDDFGTGYSSLSYLKRLPLERLKIDQGFVRNILMDADDAAISRAVIAMASSMGLGVIAEGVETEAQREFLANMGCHTYQGYLFSRPVPIAEFEALVMRG